MLLSNAAKTIKLSILLATIFALAFSPTSANGIKDKNTEDTSSETYRNYHEAIAELKAYYADLEAYDKALEDLADYLAAAQKDPFEMEPKVKIYNSDLELVDEFADDDSNAVLNDDTVFMEYENTTYYIQ